MKLAVNNFGPVAWASKINLSRLVGWDGKLAGLDSACTPHYFKNGTWTTGTKLTGQTSDANAAATFVTSAGVVLLSVAAGGGIWRSTDDGATFTKTHSFPYTDEEARTFTEDDQGAIYSHSYGHATKSVQIVKSTDGGATWTDISTATVSSADQTGGTVTSLVNRHLHAVYFCPWRKWLFVTHGDAGSKSPVLVSDDYGASFQAWGRFDTANNHAASKQVTAIVTDDAYVYMSYDVGASVNDAADDFNLYRTAHAYTESLSSLLASAPSMVYDVMDYQGGVANTGFSIWADVSEYGVIVFTHGHTPSGGAGRGLLIASEDRGDTWEVMAQTEAGAIQSYAWLYAGGSLYLPTRDRNFYNDSSDSSGGCFSFRVYPSTRKALKTTDGSLAHWQTHADEISKFSADFESASGISTQVGGSNTADAASTGKPYSGTKSLKLTCVGGSYCDGYKNALFNDGDYAEGNEAIIESAVFVEAASITGNLNLHIFTGDYSVSVGLDSSLALRVQLGGNGNAAKVSAPGWTFPLNRWVRLRSVVKMHRTQGELTVLVDNVVRYRIVGIVTAKVDGTAGALRNAQWAANTTQTLNVYHDDAYAGVLPAASVPSRVESGVFLVPGDLARVDAVQPLVMGSLLLSQPVVRG